MDVVMTSPSRAPLPYGGRLMFAQSWEDPACDRRALCPGPRDTIVAITSGGDNVLEFLLTDVERVIAVDLNPTQTYLLELKIAAFRHLSHAEMLQLLGVRPSGEARRLYARLRDALNGEAREYWDSHLDWLDRGVLVSGGFERYFALLRGALRWTVGRARIQRLFTLDPEEQRRFYEREWNGFRWRAFIRIGCSKTVLGSRLDPSWFAHAEGVTSFGAHFANLAAHAIGTLPARSNYFLAQILLGRYVDEAQVPQYLQLQNFAVIRSRLDRLQPVTGDIGEVLASLPDRAADCFALSNAFEYGPAELFERAKRELRRVARPGARIALRNLLAPRRLADDPAFVVDTVLSEELRLADRGFIYSRFEAGKLRDAQ
jgi:S-adenosylmethionine-diacylglycerol 3-amino-3-carboxypropyl transferase